LSGRRVIFHRRRKVLLDALALDRRGLTVGEGHLPEVTSGLRSGWLASLSRRAAPSTGWRIEPGHQANSAERIALETRASTRTRLNPRYAQTVHIAAP